MTTKVYGVGYSGKSQAKIKELTERLDAIIFDVRFSPRSRNPVFSGKRLQEALGDRYQHVREFGNSNYKGGPIAIVDFEAGMQRVIASDRPVILMCVCRKPSICHRTEIGQRLQEAGLEYTELDAQPPEQMEIWSYSW